MRGIGSAGKKTLIRSAVRKLTAKSRTTNGVEEDEKGNNVEVGYEPPPRDAAEGHNGGGDGELMHSLQSIQWMMGCMELCGGLQFRIMLCPSSAFKLTFFSFCCVGRAGGGREGGKGGRREKGEKGHIAVSARTHTEKCHRRNDFTYCSVESSTSRPPQRPSNTLAKKSFKCHSLTSGSSRESHLVGDGCQS